MRAGLLEVFEIKCKEWHTATLEKRSLDNSGFIVRVTGYMAWV
jgi:hypothetical protein